MKPRRITGAMLMLLTSPAVAQTLTAAPDLASSSMEELTQMQVSISSVNRKEEDLWRTAAAAYVITREDIVHSAANSIPELLRSVPGLQVAQISAATWAVSARGFNSAYANKLLVLIDGRTVYSEIYSGAHWDEIDLALDNVERIEVIRGPGAVIWGTNAANGVINIITRAARNVHDPEVDGEVSRIDDSLSYAQGASWRGDAQVRGSLSLVHRNPLLNEDGTSAYDGESLYRADTRFDLQQSNGAHLSVLGGAYGGTLHQQVLSTSASTMDFLGSGQEDDYLLGGFGLLRWTRDTSRHSYEMQGYISSAVRHELSATDRTLTESLEFVDHIRTKPRVDLVTGAELRLTQDAARAPIPVLFKSAYNNYLVDGFLQGDFVLIPERLSATLGAKVQDGTLAGFQVQPTARLAWTVSPSQFLWTAISRGVVAPAVQDKALNIDILLGSEGGLPIEGNLTGSADFRPETVLAYEAGYRRRITSKLSLDVASFYNLGHRLQSIAPGAPSLMMDPSPHIMVPLPYGNGFSATSQGVESALTWKPLPSLRFQANYTWLEAQVKQNQPGSATLIDSFNSPRNSVAGLWNWSFASKWNFGGQLDRVGALPASNSAIVLPSASSGGMDGMLSRGLQKNSSSDMSSPSTSDDSVSAYTRLDAKLECRVGRGLSLAAGGTNLFSPRHLEFGGDTAFLTPLNIPRSLFVRAHWSF